MTDTLDMVRKFHQAFDIPLANKPHLPRVNESTRAELFKFSLQTDDMAEYFLKAAQEDESGILMRLHLCMEELGELSHALANRNPVEALDALCDMRYVADGTILHLGFGDVFGAAMGEVHASNMSKLVNGEQVKNAYGRFLKPAGYFKPDLTALAYDGMEPA